MIGIISQLRGKSGDGLVVGMIAVKILRMNYLMITMIARSGLEVGSLFRGLSADASGRGLRCCCVIKSNTGIELFVSVICRCYRLCGGACKCSDCEKIRDNLLNPLAYMLAKAEL
jgi:hypothetical protein